MNLMKKKLSFTIAVALSTGALSASVFAQNENNMEREEVVVTG